MIFYIEFGVGHNHTHREKEINLNRDTLGVIYAPNERQAEWYASRHFKEDWLMIYSEYITDNLFLEKFTGGLVVLNPRRN